MMLDGDSERKDKQERETDKAEQLVRLPEKDYRQ